MVPDSSARETIQWLTWLPLCTVNLITKGRKSLDLEQTTPSPKMRLRFCQFWTEEQKIDPPYVQHMGLWGSVSFGFGLGSKSWNPPSTKLFRSVNYNLWRGYFYFVIDEARGPFWAHTGASRYLSAASRSIIFLQILVTAIGNFTIFIIFLINKKSTEVPFQ